MKTARHSDVRLSWQQVLAPQHFKLVVKAVAFVSGTTGDSFEHPSNALKAEHHVKELANIKEALAVMERNNEEAEYARDVLLVCRENWVTEISAVACTYYIVLFCAIIISVCIVFAYLLTEWPLQYSSMYA